MSGRVERENALRATIPPAIPPPIGDNEDTFLRIMRLSTLGSRALKKNLTMLLVNECSWEVLFWDFILMHSMSLLGRGSVSIVLLCIVRYSRQEGRKNM